MSYDAALTAILETEPLPDGGTRGEDVDYDADGIACRGYVARPAASSGPLPAVLVTHDWLGMSDMVRMRCDMLARLGYLAFGSDLYGVQAEVTPQTAAQHAGQFYGDRDLFRRRTTAALDRMLAEPDADASRAAAIGYCFGGSASIELARSGADLSSVVSFHGRLQTGPDGTAAAIRAHLLVLTGGSDPVVPDEQVHEFEDELRRAPEVDWQVVTYSGAMHAFAVPTANSPDHGAAFDAVADARSWRAMKDWFAETLA